MKHLHNEQITDTTIRLVDTDGNSSVVNTKDALTIAKNQGLDLVIVAAKSNPKVAKIIDFKKFVYDVKQEQKARKKRKRLEVKEIQIKPQIQDHDLNVKLKKIHKFLEDGHHVKLVVRTKGRQKYITDIGAVLTNVLSKITNHKVMSGNVTSGQVVIGNK